MANVILCGWSLVSYLHLDVRVILANDQTSRIAKWRDEALASKKEDWIGSLWWIVNEYPSGTKQIKGSSLDQIVERQRAAAVHEVLAHLRKETGQNFGDDPEAWIAKYTKN
ncbi:hypothetical protein [Armatimonas sp.]|uniref:hypothetical protein n=1 Tax=Armatimonas sp. TaxID=1872638 RepID=UPI00286B4AA2|nr:hypothetical protein [Armatimonas sp.]